uniref:Putative ovule protein n=1 Tax=Solanum chacoense TaxID=4108 RepID=A0A0V0GV05_SOLCH
MTSVLAGKIFGQHALLKSLFSKIEAIIVFFRFLFFCSAILKLDPIRNLYVSPRCLESTYYCLNFGNCS